MQKFTEKSPAVREILTKPVGFDSEHPVYVVRNYLCKISLATKLTRELCANECPRLSETPCETAAVMRPNAAESEAMRRELHLY